MCLLDKTLTLNLPLALSIASRVAAKSSRSSIEKLADESLSKAKELFLNQARQRLRSMRSTQVLTDLSHLSLFLRTRHAPV